MKLWIDDIRPAPEGYDWCKSVNEAVDVIECIEKEKRFVCLGGTIATLSIRTTVELIDIDHDLGDYAYDGGDGVKLLDWFEETGRNYPIRIHSANPVGVENMRRIIERNGWKEIK